MTHAGKYEIVPPREAARMITRTVLAIDLNGSASTIEAYKAHHRRVWPEVLAGPS